jgi:hypothetical protein
MAAAQTPAPSPDFTHVQVTPAEIAPEFFRGVAAGNPQPPPPYSPPIFLIDCVFLT